MHFPFDQKSREYLFKFQKKIFIRFQSSNMSGKDSATSAVWSFGYGSNMDVEALAKKKHVELIGEGWDNTEFGLCNSFLFTWVSKKGRKTISTNRVSIKRLAFSFRSLRRYTQRLPHDLQPERNEIRRTCVRKSHQIDRQ